MHRISYKDIKIDSGVEVKSNKIENTLTLQINNGTIENTNKYTFDGSSAKTLDIIPGTNVNLVTDKNILTINAVHPTATETTSGIVQLATTTEATTGTDTTKAVTPAGVKASINLSVPNASSIVPSIDNENGSIGTQTSYARADHVHPVNDLLKAPTELVQDLGTLTANTEINASAGNIAKLTVGAAITLTLVAGAASGRCRVLTLHITNGGAFTITWPTTVKWSGGTAPTLTASGIDVLTFMTVDGGATWLGAINGEAYA